MHPRRTYNDFRVNYLSIVYIPIYYGYPEAGLFPCPCAKLKHISNPLTEKTHNSAMSPVRTLVAIGLKNMEVVEPLADALPGQILKENSQPWELRFNM